MSKLKDLLIKPKLNQCHKEYAKQCYELTNSYGMWISENENPQDKKVSARSFANDWKLIANKDTKVDLPTKDMFFKLSSDKAGLIYADEDCINAKGIRYGHFMKPDWSPDTLESFFYFGSFVWINRQIFEAYIEGDDADTDVDSDVKYKRSYNLDELSFDNRENLYEMILEYTSWLTDNGYAIVHIPEVLGHIKDDWDGDICDIENPDKPELISQKAYWGYESKYDAIKDCWRNEHIQNDDASKVSVIIPSKDHPDILKTCIDSLLKYDADNIYEIVIVDNGSNAENKQIVEQFLDDWNKLFGKNCDEETQSVSRVKYIYRPNDFNYASMCNVGVGNSTGDVLLLLNDDVETTEPFVDKMLAYANRKHIGAVGVKLLYPDSDIIQHTGVVSMALTPEHKLMGQSDANDYYYGRNRLTYDVLAVTAACMMITRDKFERVGGFNEKLTVSYNDVDLCFFLHKKGYYNVCVPSITLKHHESLSRGADVEDDGKWTRQMQERELLYGRFPQYHGKDPFYNPNLSQHDYRYFSNYTYPFARRDEFNDMNLLVDEKYRDIKHKYTKYQNECLKVTIEKNMIQHPIDFVWEEDCIYIEGWSYVLGMDNSRYERKLLLIDKESDKMAELPVMPRYRRDVADVLPDEKNVLIAGFVVRIPKSQLPMDNFTIGMICRDKCSRQILTYFQS